MNEPFIATSHRGELEPRDSVKTGRTPAQNPAAGQAPATAPYVTVRGVEAATSATEATGVLDFTPPDFTAPQTFDPLVDENGRGTGVEFTTAELQDILSAARIGPQASLPGANRAIAVLIAASNSISRVYVNARDEVTRVQTQEKIQLRQLAAGREQATQLALALKNLAEMVKLEVPTHPSLSAAAAIGLAMSEGIVGELRPYDVQVSTLIANLRGWPHEALFRRMGVAARERVLTVAGVAASVLDRAQGDMRKIREAVDAVRAENHALRTTLATAGIDVDAAGQPLKPVQAE